MSENSERSVVVERTSGGQFVAVNARGESISFGTSPDSGQATGFSPVELLPGRDRRLHSR